MSTLRRHLSLVTTLALPEWSAGPGPDDDVLAAAADAGYEGVQVFVPDQAARAAELGMTPSAISPARTILEVDALASMWAGGGVESLTLHLGTGFETADEARALVEATLEIQQRHGVTLLVELLPARAHYARTAIHDGRREEEVDRWTQADVLWRVATEATAVAA